MISAEQKAILDGLTEQIIQASWSCAAEQHAPRHEADAMDRYIAERRKNIKALREIRQELENLFSGKLGGDEDIPF